MNQAASLSKSKSKLFLDFEPGLDLQIFKKPKPEFESIGQARIYGVDYNSLNYKWLHH